MAVAKKKVTKARKEVSEEHRLIALLFRQIIGKLDRTAVQAEIVKMFEPLSSREDIFKLSDRLENVAALMSRTSRLASTEHIPLGRKTALRDKGLL